MVVKKEIVREWLKVVVSLLKAVAEILHELKRVFD